MSFYFSKTAHKWRLVYEEGDASGSGTAVVTPPDDAAAAAKVAEEAAKKAAETQGGNEEDKPVISNKRMNAILAAERKKAQEEKQKTIDQLTQIQKAKGLSDKEKGDLANQIEELKNSMLTKEQLAEQEKKKLQDTHKKELQVEKEGKERNWKLYEDSTIKREITDAAIGADAFRPSQVVVFLQGKTTLVEDKDEDGKSLGTFSPRVKFPDTKDGKPIILDLSVAEAVKRMKDLPEEYGNLFKSGVAGGLGSTSGTSMEGPDTGPPTDPEKYKAWRAKQKKMGKL